MVKPTFSEVFILQYKQQSDFPHLFLQILRLYFLFG